MATLKSSNWSHVNLSEEHFEDDEEFAKMEQIINRRWELMLRSLQTQNLKNPAANSFAS